MSYRKISIAPRRGAAVVEFAVVAPVLIVLVMGMMEYGRMVMVQQVMVNATREGARHAILDGATAASTSTRVMEYLANGDIGESAVSVTPNPVTAARGTPITVEVTVPYSSVAWMQPMFLANTSLTASSVMIRE